MFAEAGFDDLFVAFPVVGEDKGRRLLSLADRVRLAVGVDSVEGARTLARPFREAGRSLDVLLKVDVGYGRVGVLPERAAEVARRVAEPPRAPPARRLHPRGPRLSRRDAGPRSTRSRGWRASAWRRPRRSCEPPGSRSRRCPSAPRRPPPGAMRVAGVTECRPGNYVFHDASQVGLGTCGLEDCALTVVATVVSVPAPDRAVVDAGSKTLSSDPLRPRPGGYGQLRGRSSRIEKLSEEHGVVAVAEGESFRVGERVRILPNHACVVANLHDCLVGVSGDRVEAILAVAARGRVR